MISIFQFDFILFFLLLRSRESLKIKIDDMGGFLLRNEVVLDCNHFEHYYDFVELHPNLDVNRKSFVEGSRKKMSKSFASNADLPCTEKKKNV